MIKKTLVAVAVLGVAYVGGSYYVGVRAEEQLLALMNDAQTRANNELVWEKVAIKHGVFTSTGSMELVLKEVKTESQEPVRTRFSYTIHHQLHWARLAHFVWSASPDEALAKQIQPFYPQAPSLTGDGIIDWSGVATSSISFPGIDNASVNDARLTVAPLTGSITAGENAFDLKLGVAEVSVVDANSPERVQIKSLGYEARSSDVASGSVAATFVVGDALLIGEDGSSDSMSGYRWHFDVLYKDDILNFDTKKTISSLTAMGNQASNVEVSIGIDGLHRTDLQALSDLFRELNGQWLDISQRQLARAQQLGLSMLARGFAVRAPAIKADLKLMGEQVAQTVGLENFSLTVQVTDPKLAIGKVSLALDALRVPEMFQSFAPQINGFKFELANVLTNGRVELTAKKSLDGFAQDGQTLRDVELSMRLAGFTPEGLLELVDMTSDLGGDFTDLSDRQQERLAQIMQDAAEHGLVLSVPVIEGSADLGLGQPDVLSLEGLDLQVKLDDAATGAGKASFVLKKLSASGPQMTDIPAIRNYELVVNNQVVDGKADYQIDKSIDGLDSEIVKLGPSAVSMRLTGLSAADLQRFSELAPLLEQGIEEEQAVELGQILRRAIASGFAFSIPKLQLAIDDAKVTGQADLSLAGLGNAPLASFDIARLAKMQAQLGVTGRSDLVEALVEEGVLMGLLTVDGKAAKGQVQFANGQLLLNGAAVPVDEFIAMANMMVMELEALAPQEGSGAAGNPAQTQRQRRAP